VSASPLDRELSLYAGLWIALVRGRIVATGATAHQALINCRAARLKDEPILRFIPITSIPPEPKR
jgi:hypothetical protein